MADCPNCGSDVPESERLCPSCGFDTGESQAERVRELRDEGKIHPGRLSESDHPGTDISGGVVPEQPGLPSREGEEGPRGIDAGL